jgi:asparagine synthase (glutamine-hydrolysing)
MCGIAGVVGLEPKERMRAMLDAIAHRGRDDEGIWTSPEDADNLSVCLGHRRLSIIDTSTSGHQPMLSPDGRYTITYNGELYNYREVRDVLVGLGHHFQTDSDTEVLLAAFAEWRTEALPRLNGMFAFAVWDEHERSLILVRDRLGIKPLYYASVAGAGDGPAQFVFGSEVKAILASGLVRAELDHAGLHQQLTFLWTPDPQTLFSGVRKLPPGHLLVARDGQVRVSEWWDACFDVIDDGHDEAWWRDRVVETLDRVVGLEMIADVPLGSFLSGGLDSSLLLTHMNDRRNGRRISTYTIGMEQGDLRYDIIPDDVEWARRVGALLGSDYHETMLQPEVASLLPTLVEHMEMPVIDSTIPSYLIAREARRTLAVLLSGMGGDELFAGYPRHVAMGLAGRLDVIPSAVRSPVFSAVAGALPGGRPGRMTALLRNTKKFARSAALDFEDRYLGYSTYFDRDDKRLLYTDELRLATEGLDPYAAHRDYFARSRRAAPLNRLLYVDLKTFLPCLNLDYTDKTSMASTLEVRVPYLNHELVELSSRMPPSLKLRGFRRKYILKRAAERRLPRDVVWRKKAGFGAPIRSWLRGPLRPLVDELLSEEVVRARGLFRPDAVQQVVETNLAGREDWSLQVLQLLTLEMWHRIFVDEPLPASRA